jgi:hypothetical protein
VNQPATRARSGAWLARLGRMIKTLLQAVVVLLLLIIPVPVGALFHRLFDARRGATAAKVVKKEEEPG